MSIDCPHQEPGHRTCEGCTSEHNPAGGYGMPVERSCTGEITGRVYADSDGDAGVIGGIHHFMAVEDEEASCGCVLSAAEWDAAREKLVEAYADDDGPEETW